jgi:hypothetical protein
MVSTLTASLEFPEVTFIEQDKVQFTYFSSQKKVHFHHDIYSISTYLVVTKDPHLNQLLIYIYIDLYTDSETTSIYRL